MVATNSAARALDPDRRNRLECLLVEFESSWHPGRLAECEADLPGDAALRSAAVVELAKIDLERSWQGGAGRRAEEYGERFPELAAGEGLPLDLVQVEFEARCRAGAVDVESFCHRFPAHGAALREMASQTVRSNAVPGLAAADHQTADGGPSTARGVPRGGSVGLPERFGRYLVRRRLGQGGMGAVYLAHDTGLGRDVAIKVPHLGGDTSVETLERFYREARAAAALRHPHLCPVYDVGEIDGTHFLTMAYIEGRTLADDVRDGPKAPREAAALVRQLALALAVAHLHGVVHRDLKPANVLLSDKGEPAVTDFGLARRVSHDAEPLTKAGTILGTPAYMSPEQVQGRTDEIGPASDIYSLGVILYELLTGRRPFSGTTTAILIQIATEEPDAPSRVRAGLSPQLEEVVTRAMKKNVADRYRSMGEFADALGVYLAGGVETLPVNRVAHRTAAPPAGGGRPAGKARGVWIAAGLLAAAVLVAVVAVAANKSRDRETARPTPDNPAAAPEPAPGVQPEPAPPPPRQVTPPPAPPPPASPKLAEAVLGVGKHARGATLEVVGLKRTAEDYLQVSWRYRNETAQRVMVYQEVELGKDPDEWRPSGGMLEELFIAYVSDGKRLKSQIVKDSDGKLWCSKIGSLYLNPKDTSNVYYARFGYPPRDVRQFSITFRDVGEPIDLALPEPTK